MSNRIKLSQCMIVKNEEKNIKRALTWAKDIAFEQIVVDTGSTDRTVEIAKEMGAKVYHFKWCDDFATAKNYAIEQAKGDWIAFLDADEYFSKEHTQILENVILRIDKQNKWKKKPLIIRCSWVQLNDKGEAFAIQLQDRVFSNVKSLRYQGKIHEQLSLQDGGKIPCFDMRDQLSILHTGYTFESYKNTNKSIRNIELLKKELEENPNNYNAWSYLGDSMLASKNIAEAIKCYEKSLNGKYPDEIMYSRYLNSQLCFFKTHVIYYVNEIDEEKILNLAKKVGYPNPKHPDIIFWLGVYYMKHDIYDKASDLFKKYLKLLEDEAMMRNVDRVSTDLKKVYIWMTEMSRQLRRYEDAVYYGVLSLRMDKYMDGVLASILYCLKDEAEKKNDIDSIYNFLNKIYNLNEKKDLLFVYKCSKVVGFQLLKNKILDHLDTKERNELIYGVKKTYMEIEGIPPINKEHKAFLKWVEEYSGKEAYELQNQMICELDALKRTNFNVYEKYIDYHNKYLFWGKLDLGKEIYDSLKNRSILLKEHMSDFIWLYQNLSDYCSKRTLLAILKNWTSFDIKLLVDVKCNEKCYFDLDLIPTVKDEIFVDLGAFVGDTIIDFVTTYNESYRKIYAYECSKENAEMLERATVRYERVQICLKAVGKESGNLFMKQGVEASSNRIIDENTDTQEKGYMVPVVSLDEDIKESVTWIKMNIEGAEYDALLGARNHIINDKPKLSISLDHGYDDLWRIPRLIHEMHPDYDFYLRHYGGNLVPTKYILTAIPKN